MHWGDLDQLAMTAGMEQSDLDRVAVLVRDHVALVFHLFNAGDGVRKIGFKMNGGPIASIDPFLSNSLKTQQTDWEPIDIEGRRIRLKAYTLALSQSAVRGRACPRLEARWPPGHPRLLRLSRRSAGDLGNMVPRRPA